MHRDITPILSNNTDKDEGKTDTSTLKEMTYIAQFVLVRSPTPSLDVSIRNTMHVDTPSSRIFLLNFFVF